ncbi:MAG: NADH-ubiquinone oxidoreductase-F iron-sulfur binding region domain-containing protein [Anaerolineae bacterium]
MSDPAVSPLTPILAEFAPLGRTGLLPALQAAQSLTGSLSESTTAQIASALGVPLADVHGVIDFYGLLYREPHGQTTVRVCADPACALRGGEGVLAAAQERAAAADGAVSVERATCLGLCNTGVAANVTRWNEAAGAFQNSIATHLTPSALDTLLAGQTVAAEDYVGGDLSIVSVLCGKGRVASLIEYESAGGMRGIRRALGQLTPGDVIGEIMRSGLLGRGGAAFPTGIKWESAANAPGAPKYFVINADESEPGTFKDRILMEGDPNRILEGAILGAYAIGAHKAYFYIRGEYPVAIARVRHAIAECHAAGYLGQNILGSGYDLDIEVRTGAGAYICGEETALFESIEGKRGFPRVKPPFPVTHGLFGKPTVVNNVETLAKAVYVLSHGAAAFRRFGTEQSSGPKLFCVSGDVVRPGLYEVPFGVTLRHLVEDLAGGVTGAGLQAILIGGAAGAFVGEEALDVRLSFEDLRAAGLPLGSGAVMVFNTSRDLRDVLARLARFFAHESCGKCYPCQIGTQRQYEILTRVAAGEVRPDDALALQDIGWTMTEASLCGLGQTAGSAVLSAMRLWPERLGLGR